LKVRFHILVSGRVQEVFFRSSTTQEARKRGLTGGIMNLFDGRVEAVVKEEKETIDQIVAFCKQGPEDAKVKTADVVWEPYTGSFSRFETR